MISLDKIAPFYGDVINPSAYHTSRRDVRSSFIKVMFELFRSYDSLWAVNGARTVNNYGTFTYIEKFIFIKDYIDKHD